MSSGLVGIRVVLISSAFEPATVGRRSHHFAEHLHRISGLQSRRAIQLEAVPALRFGPTNKTYEEREGFKNSP